MSVALDPDDVPGWLMSQFPPFDNVVAGVGQYDCDVLSPASGCLISDGLSADVSDLCGASGIGAVIDVELIPVSERAEWYTKRCGLPPIAFGLVLEGDIQFVTTAPEASRSRMLSVEMIRIGETVDADGIMLRRNGLHQSLDDLIHRDARGLSSLAGRDCRPDAYVGFGELNREEM